MRDLIDHLLTADAAVVVCETLDAWWPRMLGCSAPFEATVDRAAAAGFAADRLGWAFAAGYHHALRCLAPALPEALPAALAATEDGGGHPRAMTTTLTPTGDGGWRLDGAKRFVTLGARARVALVVATAGVDERGRNALRVARVDPRAPGVTMEPLPATPFTPEVEHAQARFADARVRAEDVLPGDGYDRYLKPFRTIEDLHVLAAALGHLVAAARRRAWPEALREELVAALVTARGVAAMPPSSASTHVALAGLFRAAERATAEVDERYGAATDDEAARWSRDRGILRVADRVRALRRAAAWRALEGGSGAGGE
jgi:acyl-CoA dehydrogenase